MMQNTTPSQAALALARALLKRVPNRQFFFTFTALAVWGAKIIHIYAHINAVHQNLLHRWGYSFVTQDVVVLTLIRLLLDQWSTNLPTRSQIAVLVFTAIFMFINALLSVVSISFYLVAGSEIHYSNISLPNDPSSKSLMLSGSVAFTSVLCANILLSWLLKTPCYKIHGYVAEVVHRSIANAWQFLRRILPRQNRYVPVPKADLEGQTESFDDESSDDDLQEQKTQHLSPFQFRLRTALRSVPFALASIFLLTLLYAAVARPSDRSLIFLSYTAALSPFVDFSSGPTLQDLPSVFGTGIQHSWDNLTALATAEPFDWLPNDQVLAGFEDWHLKRPHYNADVDPLKISNLGQDLVPTLKDKLQDVPIRHVVLCFLESTRNDVFPIKKDGNIWELLASTFPNNTIPQEAHEKLANLTPTANYITGDYDDGFDHEGSKPKRGGVHFTNAHTTGTFTFKSLVGTLCGIGPLLADFNLDYAHHVYQPCLAHIFEALNQVSNATDAGSRPFNDFKWQSYFYSAATLGYNNQQELMEATGFPEEHLIGLEWLRSENATHGPVTLPRINGFAFEEDPLEDYFRDVFVQAKEKEERVFLSHITSTSHHAYKLPEGEEYVPVANGHDMLSHYLNTEGYDDRWLRKILDLLDEQGVANETLIVFVGDHGISMPENGAVSPYYNPSIGIDHVPLVLSHPLLPAFDIHDAVHSSQILPTILDLLLETGSLNNASRQAASDLVRNYEGQSLIRPLLTKNETTGQGNWQFVVVNPGRAVVTARDARYPERHLAIPLIDNVEWRLSNVDEDPMEHDSVQSFDFTSFTDVVSRRFGNDVAQWVEEGAFIARWWAEENHKRWQYGEYDERETS
ncbi:alkaline-phosphatase-like protein [Fusarium oxysporum]|nr:alkaline-phosphatase-like protein [Fusarium oxysporum]